jgi:hypothetical protein
MIGSADSLLGLLHLVRVPDNLDAFNNFFIQFERNVSRLGGHGMDVATNITCKGDDAHHALVMEDTNVGLLLEEKAVNVDSHPGLCGRGRIDKIKMSVDLTVRDPPQLKMSTPFSLASNSPLASSQIEESTGCGCGHDGSKDWRLLKAPHRTRGGFNRGGCWVIDTKREAAASGVIMMEMVDVSLSTENGDGVWRELRLAAKSAAHAAPFARDVCSHCFGTKLAFQDELSCHHTIIS